MNAWQIEFTATAARHLRKLPTEAQVTIRTSIRRLAESGHGDTTKMAGTVHDWRLGVGDYRVIFRRDGDRLVILVLDVGHRREVYRG